MKDRLLYLTIGILVGVVVVQGGLSDHNPTMLAKLSNAFASNVHPGPGIIAIDSEGYLLDQNGQVWTVGNECWLRYPHLDPPMPLDQIKFWRHHKIITTNDLAWLHISQGNWTTSCGPWPGGPVPTSPETWGNVKGKYEGEK